VDGTYPIWSLLRLVNVSGAITSTVNSLASASQSFVSATHPDFVPFNNSTYGTIPNLVVERAHFTPPGIYAAGAAPAPQNTVNALVSLFTEVGGDVGGIPITYQVDTDYCTTFGAGTCSAGAGHSLTGTTAPSSSRRQ
jgi:hypothetical protein